MPSGSGDVGGEPSEVRCGAAWSGGGTAARTRGRRCGAAGGGGPRIGNGRREHVPETRSAPRSTSSARRGAGQWFNRPLRGARPPPEKPCETASDLALLRLFGRGELPGPAPGEGRGRFHAAVMPRPASGSRTEGSPMTTAPHGFRATGDSRREANAATVLRTVLDHGPVAPRTVADLSGLSPAAVSRQCTDLVGLGQGRAGASYQDPAQRRLPAPRPQRSARPTRPGRTAARPSAHPAARHSGTGSLPVLPAGRAAFLRDHRRDRGGGGRPGLPRRPGRQGTACTSRTAGCASRTTSTPCSTRPTRVPRRPASTRSGSRPRRCGRFPGVSP